MAAKPADPPPPDSPMKSPRVRPSPLKSMSPCQSSHDAIPPPMELRPPPPAPDGPPLEEVGRLYAQHEKVFHEVLAAMAAEGKAMKEREAQRVQRIAELVKQQMQRTQQRKDMAMEYLIEQTRLEREELQAKLGALDVELGRVAVHTQLGGVGEVWVDGTRPKALRKRLGELERQRQQAREEGRELRRAAKRRADSHSDAEDGVEVDGMQGRVRREVNRRQLELYRRIEGEIREQLAEFTAEKALHIKEVRRVRDEAASPFGDYPLLDKGRYLMLSLLGRGGFSEVWRAMDLDQGRWVAVKVHQLGAEWSSERRAQYLRHARREYEIQRKACHKRVVSLLGCFEINQQSFATVLEYTPYGDLDSYLKRHKDLPESTARPLMAQILSGLGYLHSQRVIHYDLKPANVLFFSPSEVKLTDFGLSKAMSAPRDGEETNIELTSQGAGTYWYLPPECFETRFTPKVSGKVDIWAAGVVFFQMLFARRPFGHEASQRQLFTDGIIANARQVAFPQKPRISDAARNIITHCLRYHPADRPSADDLLSEPYFFQTSVGPGAKKMQQRAAALARKTKPEESEAIEIDPPDPPVKRSRKA